MYDLIIATTVIVCLSLILAMYYFKTKQSITLSYEAQEAPKQGKPGAQQPLNQGKQGAQQPLKLVKPGTQPPLNLGKPGAQQPLKQGKPGTQPPLNLGKPGVQQPLKQGKPGSNKLDKKLIEKKLENYGVSSNKKVDQISKDINKLTNKLNLNQNQFKDFVENYATAHSLVKDGGKITVNGSPKNILKDIKNINKNVDINSFNKFVNNYFKNKGGDMSTSDYNKFLNSLINVGTTSQSYRIPTEPRYKTKSDIRYDINQALKNYDIPLSSSAGSAVRKYLSSALSNYNLKDMSNSTYNSILNNFGNAANSILDKLDDKMVRAVKTLNAKNSSGVLPTNSNYKDLVHSGLVYFNKDTGAWGMTQKGKQVNKALSVNNVPITNNKLYNDVSNYIKNNTSNLNNRINQAVLTLNAKNSSGVLPSDSTYKDLVHNGLVYFNKNTGAWAVTQKGKDVPNGGGNMISNLENRIQQAVKTLNAKNSSGVLPSDSTYKDLVHNGLMYFNKNTGAWTVTQKGKDIPNYLNNMMTSNVSNYLDTLSGNFSQNNYSQFLNNMINGQYLASMYATSPSQKTMSQIRSDVTNTIAKYYNVGTNSVNPTVTNMLANYVAQRDLTKLDSSEYRNLMNGVIKGYGLGNNSLTPTGQGIAGRLTIDNQPVSADKLVNDVTNVIQQTYAVRPDLIDNNIKNEVLTYLDTKGGNVSSENYNDLLVGLVRGYGIGNGTLSSADLYKS